MCTNVDMNTNKNVNRPNFFDQVEISKTTGVLAFANLDLPAIPAQVQGDPQLFVNFNPGTSRSSAIYLFQPSQFLPFCFSKFQQVLTGPLIFKIPAQVLTGPLIFKIPAQVLTGPLIFKIPAGTYWPSDIQNSSPGTYLPSDIQNSSPGTFWPSDIQNTSPGVPDKGSGIFPRSSQ